MPPNNKAKDDMNRRYSNFSLDERASVPTSISITADENSLYLEAPNWASYAGFLAEMQCKWRGAQFIQAEILYQGEEKKVVFMWFDQHFENPDERP